MLPDLLPDLLLDLLPDVLPDLLPDELPDFLVLGEFCEKTVQIKNILIKTIDLMAEVYQLKEAEDCV